MLRSITLASRPDIDVLRTSHRRPDESERIRRRAADGELVRIARGLFVPAQPWAALRPAEQHLVRVYAVAHRVRSDQLVSHVSAGIVLAVPLVSAPPERIQLVTRGSATRTTNATFVTHADLDRDDLAAVRTGSGFRTTGPERTAADIALTRPLVDGVVALDDLLRRGADRQRIAESIARRGQRGRRRAERAVELADAASGSAAESVLRVRLDEYGAARPRLQHRFRSSGQPDIVVDFWFPDVGVVVEFDGAVKYSDPTMLAGRSPHQVLLDEKAREDRLRAFPEVRAVVRIVWADLWDEHRLRAKLRAAGIHLAR